MRLRTSLLLLVLATGLPIGIFALLAARMVVNHHEETFAAAAQARNRAFMSAVDAELGGHIRAVRLLGSARILADDRIREFDELSRRALSSQPAWHSVNLQTPEGRQLVNTFVPWGTPLPTSPSQPESVAKVVATRAPVVGDLILKANFANQPLNVPVRVPIMRDGKVVYILTAAIRVDALEALIRDQHLPAGWASGLVDGKGQFIARVPTQPAGSMASETFLQHVRAANEGWYRGRTVEGLDTYTAHTRSSVSDWTVGYAIPADLVGAGGRRAAWLLGGGGVLSLLLAAGIAIWLASRISRPMSALAKAAPDMGTVVVGSPVTSKILEVQALAEALGGASRAIALRDAELRASEERFRLSQENALQAFCLLRAVRDAENRVTDLEFEYANPAAERYLRQPPGSLAGTRLSVLFPHSESNGIAPLLRKVIETGEPADAEVCDRPTGRWFRNLAARTGDSVGVAFVDITDMKRLEGELRQQAAELQAADANKSQFLAMLSHELRNPLAPLVNGLTLLERQDGRAAVETRAMMQRQAGQLRRLIDDLLDVSRIDRGKLELRRERIAIDSVVRTAIETVKPALEGKSQRLVVRYAPEPLHVDGDPVRLGQVLSNLLHNASKFTPSAGSIEIAVEAADGQAKITVSDSGIGFAPGDEQRIFDMFVQLDASRSQAASGLGLGLTLARSLAEMHGGQIDAKSEGPGRGARFCVSLPLATASAGIRPAEAAPHAPGSGRRVLVVDDNADAADSLAQILRLEGFSVRACHGGAEALAAAAELKPEVAFIDLNMPAMNGIELAKQLRTQAAGRPLSLVALTGMGQRSDEEATRAAGFHAHLTKPASTTDVLRLAAEPRHNVFPLGERRSS